MDAGAERCISDGDMVWDSVEELCSNGVNVEIGAEWPSEYSPPLDGAAMSSPELGQELKSLKEKLLSGGELVSDDDGNELLWENLPSILSKSVMSDC